MLTEKPLDTDAPGVTAGDDAIRQMMRLQLTSGPWIFQSIYVAAELGLADHLADNSRSPAELATLTGAHAGALGRFCRVLAALDILVAEPDGTYGLAPLGATLRTDAPGALRYGTLMHGRETFQAWGSVMHTVRTGEPSFPHVFGMSYFDYLDKHPDANDAFTKTMGVTDRPAPVLAECDFAGARCVVDVGGGTGSVLASILRRAPQARGILLDLPATVRDAPENLADLGVADRCEIVGASFFDEMPAGGDRYVLSRVLHDWNTEDAGRLLRRVRAAMAPDGRLVVVDHLLPEVPGLHPAVLADLHMLVILGGQDRTEKELRELLGSAGFSVTAVRPGSDPTEPRAQAAIEAVPA